MKLGEILGVKEQPNLQQRSTKWVVKGNYQDEEKWRKITGTYLVSAQKSPKKN